MRPEGNRFVAGIFLALVVSGCSTNRDDDLARPEQGTPPTIESQNASPSPATEVDASPAEAVFMKIEGYDFEDMDVALERKLRKQLLFSFGRLRPVHIAAKRVVGEDGSFVPVRVAAVNYKLPQGVPFEALAYEVGREFLGATPKNSSSFLGGRGIYMRTRTQGDPTESIAFFIREEIFVYLFGASRQAPTEEIARRLFEANS